MPVVPVLSLTVRAWLRYVVPLTLLAAVVLGPVAYLAWTAPAPVDVLAARALVRRGWILAIFALVLQLLVVAGAAPAVRALHDGAPLSQIGAFMAGMRGLVRGFVPWLTAVIAVLLGGVALVVPGVLLLVLVSMTGASEHLGAPLPAPIEDSISVARAHLPLIVMVVAAIIAIDLAITFAVQTTFVPVVGKKVTAAKLAPIRMFVRVTALALVAIAPAIGCAVAATYSHAKRRRVPGLPG
jgi:hypothetical protein